MKERSKPHSTASKNCFSFLIIWSEERTIKFASLYISNALKEANAIAEAVFFPTGSKIISSGTISIALHCSATKNLWSSLQIIIGFEIFSKVSNLFKVFCSNVNSIFPSNVKNCLG